jgi:hypothetical protein
MIWVGQFGIEDGEAREETAWVGVFPDPARERDEESADLYVIVEPALPGSEEFCGEMKQAIGEAFHESAVSLTGGMLRSLRAAHENLREWNRKSLKEHWVAAGVSCLAARDGRTFLAQVAPAAAVLYHGGAVTTIEPDLPEATEPLGVYDEFRPDFRDVELGAGDRLLLLSPSLARALDTETLAPVLALPGEEALPELYRRARGVENCGAILIAASADTPGR